MISRNFLLKLTTKKWQTNILRRLRCKDKRNKSSKRSLEKFIKWLKNITSLWCNFKAKQNKLEKFRLLSIRKTRATRGQKNNSKKFLANLMKSTTYLEMLPKELDSTPKSIKFLPKFWLIWRGSLLPERWKLNSFRTVLRKVDSVLVKTFLLCIRTRLLPRILDFIFLHRCIFL